MIIYTEHVNAHAAHHYECQRAPELENIKEYWPSSSHNKVRLPAGKYVRPGLVGWCKLHDVDGQQLAQDGRSAVPVLLEYQTPASMVPLQPEPSIPQPPSQVQSQGRSPKGVKGDEHYRAWYDQSRLWVAFTPQQLIDRFNQQYSIEDLAAYERNGVILADWRGERTASVGVTKDGQHWVDFGASEQAAHTLTYTIGYSHEPRVPDITELYYDSQLPTVRGERAGVNQGWSYVAAIVARGTRHEPTNARLWHDLCQLD